MARSPVIAWLAGLVALRVAIPLVALAAPERDLGLIPGYDFDGLSGDATGFYVATREFMAAYGRLHPLALTGLGVTVLALAVLISVAWRRHHVAPAWLIAAGATSVALAAAAAVTQMHPPGAAVFGWPFLWSVVLAPARVLGVLDPGVGFALGVPLSLAANALTVVATYYAGLYATRRRAVGMAAAALYSLWPLLTRLVSGERAWENGSWAVDTGLAMYSEPLSTALVTTALALLLSPNLSEMRLGLAGLALSLATAVRLTNMLLAAGVLALLILRLDPRRLAAYLAGALAFAPVVLAYWPKGYLAYGREEFSLSYVDDAWTDSTLFTPQMLLLLVPVAVLGWFAVRAWHARSLLGLFVLVNAVFYSFYRVTELHPRFLFASLPALFVLWCAGIIALAEAGRRLGRRHAGGDNPGGEATALS